MIEELFVDKMGIFGSSEESVEEKTVDSTGHVNNNIVIQEARDTHQQVLIGERLMYATYVLVIAEIIKLGIYLYTQWRNKIKKKYESTRAVPAPE